MDVTKPTHGFNRKQTKIILLITKYVGFVKTYSCKVVYVEMQNVHISLLLRDKAQHKHSLNNVLNFISSFSDNIQY